MLQLTLYMRRYCHLCHEMIDAINGMKEASQLQINQVDIDLFPELEMKYGEDVPVLLYGDQEVSRHRLDTVRLRDIVVRTQT